MTDITNRDVVDFLEQYIAAEQANLTTQQLANITSGVNSIIASVNSLTAGQDALINNLGAFETTVLDLLGRIYAIVPTLQPALAPVLLPPNPPAAYGGDAALIAQAVWSFPSAITSNDANDRLDDASGLAINLGAILASFPSGDNPPWVQYGTWNNAGSGPTSAAGTAPAVSYATILSTDATATDWINRAYPGYGAVDLGDGRPGILEASTGYWTLLPLSQFDFEQIRDGVSPGVAALVPPIWPGIANVTLGAPVALVDGLTLSAPLDGVLVEGVIGAPGKQFVNYGAMGSWRHVASLTFVTDNGDVEAFQVIDFGSGLYCSLRQKRASGVLFHVSPGTTGTVIPWSVT
jgi:hypothetical protein